MIRSFASLAMIAAAVPSCTDGPPPATRAAGEKPPPGVEQLLPRGGIPAIFAPRFVPGAQARVPDDAWVLGVVVEGEAKAYSLNLLNRHEVVNDRSGGTAFAAVW
jgi:hypothetical protein